jgi:hypothetical protein
MDSINAFVGLDVHKETISVAVADSRRDGEVRFWGTIPNTSPIFRRLLRSWPIGTDALGLLMRQGHVATRYIAN